MGGDKVGRMLLQGRGNEVQKTNQSLFNSRHVVAMAPAAWMDILGFLKGQRPSPGLFPVSEVSGRERLEHPPECFKNMERKFVEAGHMAKP